MASSTLRELATVFLRLGATSFGGPAAHIAMMRQELVERRAWLSEEEFLDLLGASEPDPRAELDRARDPPRPRAAPAWRGLLVAGACFILPAALLIAALAWVYVRYGRLPEAGGAARTA